MASTRMGISTHLFKPRSTNHTFQVSWATKRSFLFHIPLPSPCYLLSAFVPNDLHTSSAQEIDGKH